LVSARSVKKLGFRFGRNGAHAARTMMLRDLRILLVNTPNDADRQVYASAILVDNLLGKATRKTRELTFRHLTTLYALQAENR